MGRTINRAQLAEVFEFLDATRGAEPQDLWFRFGLTGETARLVLAAWSKTHGLGSIDERIDETFDALAIH